MSRGISLLIFAALMQTPLSAQRVPGASYSGGAMAGVFAPMAENTDGLSNAVALGVQVERKIGGYLALTATYWWAQSEAENSTLFQGREAVDLFNYDLGLEFRMPPQRGEAFPATPFLGMGAGGRTYHFRNVELGAETDWSGFASMGVELDFEPCIMRLEGRGYVSPFDGFAEEKEKTEWRRNFAVTAGLFYNFSP